MAAQHEVIAVPAVPMAEMLQQAMSTAGGQLATITDLYQDVARTAQSLSDHVSSSGVTHDALDTMQGIQNQRIHDLEQRLLNTEASLAQAQQAQNNQVDYNAIAQIVTAAITTSLGPVLTAIATAISTPGSTTTTTTDPGRMAASKRAPLQELRSMSNTDKFK